MKGIASDEDVLQYALNKASTEILQQSLSVETQQYLFKSLITSFDFKPLMQEWRNHHFSYAAGSTEISEKKTPGLG